MQRAHKQIIGSLIISGLAALLLVLVLYREQATVKRSDDEGKIEKLVALQDIRSLSLQRDGQIIQLSPRDDVWWMTGQTVQAGDDALQPCLPLAIARIFDGLSEIPFERVLVDNTPKEHAKLDLKGMGLKSPRLVWTAQLQADKHSSLRIGQSNAMSGLIYVETRKANGDIRIGLVKSLALSGLDVDAFRLRDRRLLRLADKNIGRLQFDLDDRKALKIFHDGPQDAPWRSMPALAEGQKLQQEAVAQSLQILRNSLWAQKWKTEANTQKPLGLDIDWNLARRLQIFDFAQKLRSDLRISPLYKGHYYVWRADQNALYVIKDRSLDQWPHQLADLLETSADQKPRQQDRGDKSKQDLGGQK